MTILAVINPKGGIGKSTLATHVAAYWSLTGKQVALGDADRQQSSRMWLKLRPANAASIMPLEVSEGRIAKPPKGTTHLVLDTPGGMHGPKLQELLKITQKVLIPIQPSLFDILATQGLLDELAQYCRNRPIQLAVVAVRVYEDSFALDRLKAYLRTLNIPALAFLKESENYPECLERGLTVLDDTSDRTLEDRMQWRPICQWLDI